MAPRIDTELPGKRFSKTGKTDIARGRADLEFSQGETPFRAPGRATDSGLFASRAAIETFSAFPRVRFRVGVFKIARNASIGLQD